MGGDHIIELSFLVHHSSWFSEVCELFAAITTVSYPPMTAELCKFVRILV